MSTPAAPPRLFFDLDVSGHHPEYFYHLIQYRARHPEAPRLLLGTHPDCPARIGRFPAPPRWPVPGIDFVHPTPEELAGLAATGSVARRAALEFRILRRMALAHPVQQACLLSMDKFQFVLGTAAAGRVPWHIGGILMHPLQPGSSRQRSVVVRLRKHLQLLWMLRNRRVNRVFVLNNGPVATYLNDRFRREGLFVPLPDPVLQVQGTAPTPAPAAPPDQAASGGRTRFLVFGHLSRRKGVYLALQALQLLPPGLIDSVAVVFAGHVEPAERQAFLAAVDLTRRTRPGLDIEVLDRFVEYGELGALFGRADCVLVTYVGLPEASSGVLGHAALFGKPVIGPAVGLVGDLIRAYGLGLTVEGGKADELAAAMARACRGSGQCADAAGMARYAAEREPEKFAGLLVAGAVPCGQPDRGTGGCS